jgi:phosphopantothenoylcysteine decarboxylase / phosphopantothenate---cysteine ligase
MKIALGVTGCIAAYKAIEVMRELQKKGVSVRVILTRSARNFVTPLTFEAFCAEPVITGMFHRNHPPPIPHIQLAQEVGLLAVVPATANILGKFAHGVADDFLSTFYLSCPAPVLLAPAMNVEMWHHPCVRQNVGILKERGHHFVDPESGDLACGMRGEGRLAAVDSIVAGILGLLGGAGDYSALKVLVTAGPTVEDIDPVRFLSNRSSGKMGYAVAQAARQRGAEVTLVSGPTELPRPAGVRVLAVRSAAEMKEAVLAAYPDADVVVMAAAVADYRPANYAAQKMKKSPESSQIPLVPTEDILLALGKAKTRQALVGFAAETEDLLPRAREKMARKNLDLIVANDVLGGVFGADCATAYLLTRDQEAITVQNAPKLSIAHRILDQARSVLRARRQSQGLE